MGVNELQLKINEYTAKYKTNFVISKIDSSLLTGTGQYKVEVWYNFDVGTYVITAYVYFPVDE